MKSIDEYIAQFPADIKVLLQQVRETIREMAPEAVETIKYGMPTFVLNENLVHFAGYTKHIGFYPTPSGLNAFSEEVNQFKHSKGAVQFPLDKPLPLDLVRKITKFRIEEVQRKYEKNHE